MLTCHAEIVFALEAFLAWLAIEAAPMVGGIHVGSCLWFRTKLGRTLGSLARNHGLGLMCGAIEVLLSSQPKYHHLEVKR